MDHLLRKPGIGSGLPLEVVTNLAPEVTTELRNIVATNIRVDGMDIPTEVTPEIEEMLARLEPWTRPDQSTFITVPIPVLLLEDSTKTWEELLAHYRGMEWVVSAEEEVRPDLDAEFGSFGKVRYLKIIVLPWNQLHPYIRSVHLGKKPGRPGLFD